jgi:hypothetical protein
MSIFGLGPLPKETTETPAAPAAAGDGSDLLSLIQKQSADRKAYFDRLTQQLKDRRYGPSASERLFAISAALAQPTRTPGFGGMLANVTPVFEQYAKDKRAAEAARASDMEKLGLARLNMGDDEIKTALELQRLRAEYAKAGAAKVDPLPGGGYQQQPGTGGAPPMPTMDSYGNYVITDMRQLTYLPANTPVVEAGQDPTKPKYVPPRTPR